MRQTYFLIIFFTSIFSYAEDFTTIDQLTLIRKEREVKVQSTQIDRVERNSKSHFETSVEKIVKSGTEVVVIKKGSTLVEFETNRTIILENNLNALVYKESDEFGYFYLKQKNNLIKYKVFRTQIHLLTQVVKMYEPPEEFVGEKYKKKFEYFDKNLYTAHIINYDYEFITSNFTSEVLGENNAITGTTVGYSYTYITNWDFPIDFGLFGRYEQTTFDPGFYDYIINRTFLVGAQFNSKTIWWDTSRYQVMGRFSMSPLSRLTTRYLGGIDRYDLQTYALEIGIERHFENYFGEFILGASYKKRWIELDETNSTNFINDLNTNDTSIGFYIAQRFGKVK